MARLLSLVEAGAVDTVIIAKLDRLTRSVADLAPPDPCCGVIAFHDKAGSDVATARVDLAPGQGTFVDFAQNIRIIGDAMASRVAIIPCIMPSPKSGRMPAHGGGVRHDHGQDGVGGHAGDAAHVVHHDRRPRPVVVGLRRQS